MPGMKNKQSDKSIQGIQHKPSKVQILLLQGMYSPFLVTFPS